jgi:dTDP-glucose 4,6-dehydratase
MKTVLITGGAGFIGSNFVRYIFDKYPRYKIVVLDALTYAGNPDNLPNRVKKSKRFKFWYGNVTNDDLVNMLVAHSDIVVHFAAESHVARSIFDNKIFYLTDVLGTQSVVNAIVKNNQIERFIHISTSEVYGTVLSEPMDEEHPLNPTTPYASAKAGADRLVYSYWKTYGIPAVILRPFNQYGPYQHLEKVIPRFITSVILNEKLTVHGTGEARRDWLFVEDTCQRIDRAMHVDIKKIKGEVINLGSGFSLDILSIAKMILKMMKRPRGKRIAFTSDRFGQVQNHLSSTEKAERLLSIKPGRRFENGLEQTIKWYKDNKKWWEPLIWMRHVPIVNKQGKVEYY